MDLYGKTQKKNLLLFDISKIVIFIQKKKSKIALRTSNFKLKYGLFSVLNAYADI